MAPVQPIHQLPNAFDHDSPSNGIVRYELENLNLITLSHYQQSNYHQLTVPNFPDDENHHSDEKTFFHGFRSVFNTNDVKRNFSAFIPETQKPQKASDRVYFGCNNHDAIMPFSLKSSRKIDGTTEVKLLLKSCLDREFLDKYNLRLTAYDRGGKSGFIGLLVKVLDANDHKPVFERPSYRVSISENAHLATPILVLKAYDFDLGDNSLISYHFSSQTKLRYPSLDETFRLHPFSGELSLVGKIDYEKKPFYRFFQVILKTLGCFMNNIAYF